MFNVKIYKLFNNDLHNLNNNQLQIHWKIKGKKEKRIFNIKTFYEKYPHFNIDIYKKESLINFDKKDDIFVMINYHNNYRATSNETALYKIFNKNDNNVNNINDNKDIDNKIYHNIDKYNDNNDNNENNDNNYNNNDKKNTNTNLLNKETYKDLMINDTKIKYNIFLINKNNNLSKILNYIDSKCDKKYLLKINILSNEDINIYKELYHNLIIYNIKYINNNNINYHLKKIQNTNIIYINNINNFEINIFDNILQDLSHNSIKYINYDKNIHIFSEKININKIYFNNNIVSYFNNSNKYKYILRKDDELHIYNDKIYNLIYSNTYKRINNYQKNILINYNIVTYEDYIGFFYLLQFTENNKINLFIAKNKHNSFFNNFNQIIFSSNCSIIDNIDDFKKVLNNTNLIIKQTIFEESFQYNPINNKHIYLNKIMDFYNKLYFLNLKRKIIGIFIDKNNYNEIYIINCLSNINFEEYYILVFCEDNDFINELELLKNISYLNSNDIHENLFEKKEDIISFMLVCDYLILNNNYLSVIISYLNKNSLLFLPYEENKYLSKYYVNNITFIPTHPNFIDFNNKLLIIFHQKYIVLYNKLINCNLIKNEDNEAHNDNNKIKNTENIIDISYLQFYFINKLNKDIELVSIYNIPEKNIHLYNESFNCGIVNNNNNLYMKIFDKVTLLNEYNINIIDFYKQFRSLTIQNININQLTKIENEYLYFKLYVIIHIESKHYLPYVIEKISKIDKNFDYTYFIIINDNEGKECNEVKECKEVKDDNFTNNQNKKIHLFLKKNEKVVEDIINENINMIDNDALLLYFKNIYFYEYNLNNLQLLYLMYDQKIIENNDYKIHLKKYISNKNNNIYNYEYFLQNNYYKNHVNISNSLLHSNINKLKYIIYLYEIFGINQFDNEEYINLEIKKYSDELDKNHQEMLLYYIDIKNLLNHNILEDISKEIINIEKRNDKLDYILKECFEKNINNYNIFEGIVPSKDDIINCPYIDTQYFMNISSNKYIIGSSGCKMSHVALLEKYKNAYSLYNQEYLFIIEDDAFFDINFQVYLEIALKSLNISSNQDINYNNTNDNNNDFDILYLSVNLAMKEDAYKVQPFLLKVLHGKTTTSYIVNIKNINKILDTIYKSSKEIDDVYSDSTLNKYCVYPMVVHQSNFQSDISYVEKGYGYYHEKFEY